MAESEKDHLFKLMRQCDTAMLVTKDEKTDALRSRPMRVGQIEENGDMWFITEEATNKVNELEHDNGILLTFQKEGEFYISLCGKAELTRNRQKLEEIWKEEFTVWFPKGLNDPRIMLIHVRPIDAEYWDNAGLSKIRYAKEAISALMHREQPHVKRPEQFGHVEFRPSVT